jgi:hypothetical protein
MSRQGLLELRREDRKKEIERRYVEEARIASSIFPKGELMPNKLNEESPDFLLHAHCGTIGIEVTELCREEPRKQAGTLAHVVENAKRRYSRLSTVEPIDVNVVFSMKARTVKPEKLIERLVEFVQTHRKSKESAFPEGYIHIGIRAPRETNPSGRWQQTVRAFDVTLTPEELLASRIEEKNRRLSGYRRAASAVWLLIVNDQFLGSGQVYSRPEDLARWKFNFGFDKVLLFLREPGGGEVFELHR